MQNTIKKNTPHSKFGLKHLLFSALMLLSAGTAWADVEINETNFPDENFRSWLRSQSYGEDGVLTDEEIAGIFSMDVSSKEIQSLQGIEYFTALYSLSCSYNQLTSLDVSKNTALKYLYCDSNQLTSLDVSGCTALKVLYCYSNLLTSLDVSKNTALKELSCSDNQLTSLDMSGCTALTHLECFSNRLTSLDVSGCSALTKLYCWYNQLTSLDVSKNTALNSLSCYNNLLTSLDVSGCTALTRIECYNNQLTLLDVSGCSALTTLHCYLNKIKGAAMDVLVGSLPTASYGEMYVISNENEQNVMTTSQVANVKAKGWKPYYNDGNVWKDFVGIIQINKELFPDENFRNYILSQSYGSDGVLTDKEIMEVSSIDVSSKSILNLQGVEIFNELTSLRCPDNQLTSLDVSKNTALKELYCYSNQLTSLDVSKNTALTELSCNNNELTSLDVSKNTALTSLDCSDNKFTSLQFSKNELITLNVSNNTALTSLDCHFNRLVSLDVSGCTALDWLYCGGNRLTSLDVSGCTALRELNCVGNKLTSLDVSKNTKLTDLYCSYNQLTSLDVSKNTWLQALNCYNNKIKGEEMSVLVESLRPYVHGILKVINNEDEQNVMTAAQVVVVKSYGWTPYYTEDGTNWKEYTGVNIMINEENFPDVVFRNYLINRTYVKDDVLTAAEINGVSEIDVSLYRIQSLKGIEYLTALKSLDCRSAQLASLDVSKNARLYKLKCSSNQLTSLDVSGCSALRELWCSYNQLTSLDVSKNTALTYLYCGDNQLTSLDVSKNMKLTELNCSDNQLTSLDVSKNTKLTRLECFDNQLTSLGVSECTALTNIRCFNNHLTSLDVSGCTALGSLTCYQNQIKGDGMDAFVESLPVVSQGSIYVIYDNNEQNVMTTTQVAAAKAKGWTPRYYGDYYDATSWHPYEGVDPVTSVNSVEASEAADDSAPWYTINGVQLTGKPTAPGIYIHGGKKVVVK